MSGKSISEMVAETHQRVLDRGLMEECRGEIQRTLERLSRAFKTNPPPYIDVFFDLRGMKAGEFSVRPKGEGQYEYRIRLNLILLRQEGERFIKRTPAHEACHYFDYLMNGCSSHGKFWKLCMGVAGKKPTRCHDYNLKNSIVGGSFPYHCKCRTHYISKIIHGKILRGQKRMCTKCGEDLKPGEIS